MANYFSQYKGGGPAALPPGYMEAATAPGRYLAEGFASVGENIAAGLEKYRKNKEKREILTEKGEWVAEQKMQDLALWVEEDPQRVDTPEYEARLKDVQKFSEGIAEMPLGKLESAISNYALDREIEDRRQTQEYREATLKQGDEKLDVQRRLANASISKSAAELAEKDEKKMQDTAYLETEAQLAEISPVRFEEYVEPNVPQSTLGPPMMSSRKINRTPEEMRSEALEIFASKVSKMGVSNAGALMERINEAYPTPLTSNLKVTTLPDGEKIVENVKSGWAQQLKDDKGESPTVTAAKIRSKDLEIDRRLDAVKAVDAKIESRKKDIVEIKKEASGAITPTDQELLDILEAEIKELEKQKQTRQNKLKFNFTTKKIE